MVRRMILRALALAALLVTLGCAQAKFPSVPGHTEIAVSGVEIEPREGEHLTAGYEVLLENMGLRAGKLPFPMRGFNPYRLIEDRRRVKSYLDQLGYFDGEVDEPELKYNADKTSVAVVWHVHEGARYTISQVTMLGAPPAYQAELERLITFKAGDHMDLELFRPIRRDLAEKLQDHGFGHARGYSRTFVDRDKKTVAWFFYLDPGPQTKIGEIHVEGNHRVPAHTILARTGLAPGGKYSTSEKRRAELALLDTGAFASAVVLSDADIQTGPPEHPDTGGALAPEQVDAGGNLVPRELPSDLSVRVIVVEAPARQLRGEVGFEADPTRADAYAGTRIVFRNLFAPQHHLVLEGNVGYGWILDDEKDPATGVYGSALVQYLHPEGIGHDVDVRLTGRYTDTPYPSELLREFVVGPGGRSTLAPGVFVDVDAFYRIARTVGMPTVDPTANMDLALATSADSKGGELVASFIADRRDDRVEPQNGWFAGVRGTFSPGGALADQRWLQTTLDLRAFKKLGHDSPWSVGARVSSGWVFLADDSGVPLGARLFGGGTYGFRGFGRDHLSPVVDDVPVGGRSLVESSLEARLLPFRKQFGAAVFLDGGAAGAGLDAFENGIDLAFGVGARLRLWYLPIAVDVAYRFVDHSDLQGLGTDRLLAFFRIGEAF